MDVQPHAIPQEEEISISQPTLQEQTLSEESSWTSRLASLACRVGARKIAVVEAAVSNAHTCSSDLLYELHQVLLVPTLQKGQVRIVQIFRL